MPTASAIVGDLIDVVTGRAGLAVAVLEPLVRVGPPVLHAPSQVKSRYYLRFTIADRPGVLAKLAQFWASKGSASPA